ncbi:hypothetical protein OZK63_38980 [Streptomyces sp. UMAF16]|nr:hypothetical protein [Streptomyces sp. UMAF16]
MPEDERTPDADRAWWDLNAVCLITPGPDADIHLADFIESQYADKAGALVFACLLHLSGDSSGARFWWRFAAGVGHHLAEYCLFLEHVHSGEYHDADHWRTQPVRHQFTPTLLCGERSTAPLLSPLNTDQIHSCIRHQHHPEIGTVPLPTPPAGRPATPPHLPAVATASKRPPLPRGRRPRAAADPLSARAGPRAGT